MNYLQHLENYFIICVILTFGDLHLTFSKNDYIAIIAKSYLGTISFPKMYEIICHLEWYKIVVLMV